jgi:hypothetical protein
MASAAAIAASPRKVWPVLRTIGLVILVLVVAYAAFALYLATRPVVISFNAVQRFGDSLPKPAKPEYAAWPGYRAALEQLGFVDGSFRAEGVRDALGNRPGDPQWALLSAWVDANQPGIAAARAASKRPVFAFPIAGGRTPADEALFPSLAGTPPGAGDWKDREVFPMLGLLLPQYGAIRGLANALATDMFRAVEQGDGARATDDLEAILAISIHVTEGRILIGDLVAMAIRRTAAAAVIGALEWKPAAFTDDQLRRMQAALRSVPPALERLDLSAERLMFEDAVQRFFSDDGRGDGWFVPTWAQMCIVNVVEGASANSSNRERAVPLAATAFVSVLRPIGSVMVAGRKETLAHYEAFTRELEAASVGSPRIVLEQVTPIDARQEVQSGDARQRTRYSMETLLAPALSKAALNVAIDCASRESARAAIAAELFHRANKRWPTSAADLAAFNGGIAPSDPWGDGPIRMASDQDGFRMWSVGRDGKDDGGRVPPSDGSGRASSSTHPNQPAEGGTTVDWVWFAPRGNLDRWRD